jgi:hypothetical protein
LSTILGTGFVGGLNDGVADLNAAGGICGATVVLDLADTNMKPSRKLPSIRSGAKQIPHQFQSRPTVVLHPSRLPPW